MLGCVLVRACSRSNVLTVMSSVYVYVHSVKVSMIFSGTSLVHYIRIAAGNIRGLSNTIKKCLLTVSIYL